MIKQRSSRSDDVTIPGWRFGGWRLKSGRHAKRGTRCRSRVSPCGLAESFTRRCLTTNCTSPTNGRQHWQSHAPSCSQHASGISAIFEFNAGWGSSSSQHDCSPHWADESLRVTTFHAPTARHESLSAIVVAIMSKITSGRNFAMRPPRRLNNSVIVERTFLQSETFEVESEDPRVATARLWPIFERHRSLPH